MSYTSSTEKLRDLFEYETDDAIGFLNGIFGCESVDAAILEAQTRAQWLQGRWQYWTRQAIAEANHSAALRGPGLLYVPLGFAPENSAFGAAPFLFDDYRAPTGDPAEADRRRRCPRIDQLDEMQRIYDFAVGRLRIPPDPGLVRQLHDTIDGPRPLQRAMLAYLENSGRDSGRCCCGVARYCGSATP